MEEDPEQDAVVKVKESGEVASEVEGHRDESTDHYSVVGLVCPRMEEQISGAVSSKKFKRPSIRGWEGPSYCPKYSKLYYDQFGGRLEASNPPHLFTGRLPPSY